jgi:hypothetical protein
MRKLDIWDLAGLFKFAIRRGLLQLRQADVLVSNDPDENSSTLNTLVFRSTHCRRAVQPHLVLNRFGRAA